MYSAQVTENSSLTKFALYHKECKCSSKLNVTPSFFENNLSAFSGIGKRVMRILKKESFSTIQTSEMDTSLKAEADKKMLSELLELIFSCEFMKNLASLQNCCAHLDNEKSIILLKMIIKKNLELKVPITWDRFLDLFTLEKLQEMIRSFNPEFLNISQSVKTLNKIHPYLQKYEAISKQNQILVEFQRQRPVIVNFFANLLNTIMMAFNLLEIGKSPGTYFEAKYMLDIYWRFLTIPMIVFQILSLYFLSPVKVLVVFSLLTLMSLCALYAYFRWLRPCPDEISSFAKNLTIEAKKGNLEPVLGREKEIHDLIFDLTSNVNGSRKHPLLLGRSGIGKTELVKGLAQRIATGDVPPSLKEKKIFHINAASLIPSPGSYEFSPLEQIKKALRYHAHEVILFLDEFESLIGDQEAQVKIRNELLTLLDTSLGSFPFCIAATTEEVYENHIKNTSFERRFEPHQIPETNESETLLILRSFVQREAPELEVNEESLKFIFDFTNRSLPTQKQPGKSKNIVSRALAYQKTHENGSCELYQRLRQKNNERDEMISKLAKAKMNGQFIATLLPTCLEDIEKVELAIEKIKQEINAQENAWDLYKNLKKMQSHQEKSLFQTCQAIFSKNHPSQSVLNALQKNFLFSLYFLLPCLDEAIEQMIQNHHLQVKITPDFIKKILNK